MLFKRTELEVWVSVV